MHGSGLREPGLLQIFPEKENRNVSPLQNSAPEFQGYALVGTAVALFAVAICFGSQEIVKHKSDANQINPGVAAFDPQVQEIADEAIEEAISDHEGAYAFAVVSDPNSGRILAVANKDNRPQTHSNPHWSLSLRSEPASVIKTMTIAAAIEKGDTEIDEVHNCENGKYVIDGKVFEDWKPFDYLTTAKAIVHSSNICSIKVARRRGAANLSHALSDFGFGEGGTAEAFPEARPGIVPEIGQMSDAYYSATVGVGFSGLYATPIEVVQAYGAIANGGKLLEPHSDAESRAQDNSSCDLRSKCPRHEKDAGRCHGAWHGHAVSGEDLQACGKDGNGLVSGLSQGKRLDDDRKLRGFWPRRKPSSLGLRRCSRSTVKPMTGSRVAPVFRQIAEDVLQLMHVPAGGNSK